MAQLAGPVGWLCGPGKGGDLGGHDITSRCVFTSTQKEVRESGWGRGGVDVK